MSYDPNPHAPPTGQPAHAGWTHPLHPGGRPDLPTAGDDAWVSLAGIILAVLAALVLAATAAVAGAAAYGLITWRRSRWWPPILVGLATGLAAAAALGGPAPATSRGAKDLQQLLAGLADTDLDIDNQIRKGTLSRYRSFAAAVGQQLSGRWAFEDTHASYILLDGVALGDDTPPPRPLPPRGLSPRGEGRPSQRAPPSAAGVRTRQSDGGTPPSGAPAAKWTDKWKTRWLRSRHRMTQTPMPRLRDGRPQRK